MSTLANKPIDAATCILLGIILLCFLMMVEGWVKQRRIKAKKRKAIKIDDTPDENGNCRTCGGNCGQCGWSGGGN